MVSSTSKNINVRLPSDLYSKLRRMMVESECKSWVDFFERIASGEVDVRVEFLEIQPIKQFPSTDPKDYKVTLRLGDYMYRFEHGTHQTLSKPVSQEVAMKLLSKVQV